MTNNPTPVPQEPSQSAKEMARRWYVEQAGKTPVQATDALAAEFEAIASEAEQRGAERAYKRCLDSAVRGMPDSFVIADRIRELSTEARSAMADSPEYPTAEVAEAHARATQAKIDKALEWYQETIIGDSPSKGETE